MPELNNTEECEQILGSFLIEQFPPELREAYCILASLQYPILDKKSLQGLLANTEAGEISKEIIIHSFHPGDFGLDSAQGALEKFQSRLSSFSGEPTGGPVGRPVPFVPPDVPDIPSEPGPGLPGDFGGGPCGEAAQAFYAQQVLTGESPLKAWVGAMLRASHCRRAMPDDLGTDRCAAEARRRFAYDYFFSQNPDPNYARRYAQICRIVAPYYHHPGVPVPWHF